LTYADNFYAVKIHSCLLYRCNTFVM